MHRLYQQWLCLSLLLLMSLTSLAERLPILQPLHQQYSAIRKGLGVQFSHSSTDQLFVGQSVIITLTFYWQPEGSLQLQLAGDSGLSVLSEANHNLLFDKGGHTRRTVTLQAEGVGKQYLRMQLSVPGSGRAQSQILLLPIYVAE